MRVLRTIECALSIWRSWIILCPRVRRIVGFLIASICYARCQGATPAASLLLVFALVNLTIVQRLVIQPPVPELLLCSPMFTAHSTPFSASRRARGRRAPRGARCARLFPQRGTGPGSRRPHSKPAGAAFSNCVRALAMRFGLVVRYGTTKLLSCLTPIITVTLARQDIPRLLTLCSTKQSSYCCLASLHHRNLLVVITPASRTSCAR